jgi:hypothetical protein
LALGNVPLARRLLHRLRFRVPLDGLMLVTPPPARRTR